MSKEENQNTIPLEIIPIFLSLSLVSAIIALGYFHGNMNVGAVWHNLHNVN
jgi:hypothetical protein